MKILGKNYYETLGVNQTATTDEIKSAFRGMIKLMHPDTNNSSQLAEACMMDLNEIFATLSDPFKRKLYDLSLGQVKTIERVVVREREPLARCIICRNPLDAAWKTLCLTHYKESKGYD